MSEKKSALGELTEFLSNLSDHARLSGDEARKNDLDGDLFMDIKYLLSSFFAQTTEALDQDLSDMRDVIEKSIEGKYAMGGGGAGGDHVAPFGITYGSPGDGINRCAGCGGSTVSLNTENDN